MKKLDVYDFDGTLYKKDSSVQFFLYCLKQKHSLLKYIPGIIFYLIFNKIKIVKKETLKGYFFKFLNDFDNIDIMIDKFWESNKNLIRTDLIENNVNEKVVISASPEFLLKNICKNLKIKKLIASNVDKKNGKFKSINCHDKEKINALNKVYSDYEIENFYSDSYSDEPLAKKAKNAYIIINNEIKKWDFNKFNRFVSKTTNILFTVIMLYILIACLFFSCRPYAFKKEFILNNFSILLIGLILFAFLIFVLKKSFAFKRKKAIDCIIIIISAFLIFLLYYRSKNFWILTGWDAGMIRSNANFIANNQLDLVANGYYSIFQNNIFITIVLSCVVKISNLIGVFDSNSSLLFFNCVIYSLTGMILYFNIKMLTKGNQTIAIFGYIIYILLIGLSPWISIPYSDSFALFLVTLGLFNYLNYKRGNKFKFIYLFLFYFTMIFGLKIKPQIFILFIAYIIINIPNFRINMLKHKNIYISLLLLFVSFATVFGVSYYTTNKYFKIDKEANFGIANYLMWGHNYRTRGIYPSEDVSFSLSFKTNKERNKADMDKAMERIKYLGFNGLSNLYLDKTLTNFNDGTFAWENEGGFYQFIYSTGNKYLMPTLQNYYYGTGINNWMFKLNSQIIWITTLFICLLASIKTKNQKIDIVKLSLIGLFIFELLFEARARYIFAYVPFFIIIMCDYIYEKFNDKLV